MMSNNQPIYDKGKVIAGLLILAAVMTFPFWYNLGKAATPPTVELSPKAKAAGQCVASKDYMRTSHMQLLDTWRDTVVREGKQTYISATGKSYDMSLTKTCLGCHVNKAEFCDRCHTYASVDPYCWDCHIQNPKENM